MGTFQTCNIDTWLVLDKPGKPQFFLWAWSPKHPAASHKTSQILNFATTSPLLNAQESTKWKASCTRNWRLTFKCGSSVITNLRYPPQSEHGFPVRNLPSHKMINKI
jgi:hypothetical protein